MDDYDTVYMYVNGYGAPADILTDLGYQMYLSKVRERIHHHPECNIQLYLYGGYTNRLDLSEARAMETWFLVRGDLGENVTVHVCESTTTAKDNIVHFANMVGRHTRVLVYCEESRAPRMRFLTDRVFDFAIVKGIPFDPRSMAFPNPLKERTVRLLLEAAAWYGVPGTRLVQRVMRARHVERERAKTR